jgi:hypothetical protein
MQTWHEIFQTRVESKVDGFIPIADKGDLVHYIFTISERMIAAVYIFGGFPIFWGIGLRLEPGTNLAACRRANR